MQTKQPQTKSYSYHFSKNISKAPQSATLSSIQPFSPISTSKNVNINFRYHTETPQADRKGLSFRGERLKTQNCSENFNQPYKKYTFSLLAYEARQQRLQQNKQLTSQPIEMTSRDATKQTAKEATPSESGRQHSILKKRVNSVSNGQNEKTTSVDAKQDQPSKDNSEKQLSELRRKNEHLQTRMRELEKQLSEKDEKINECTHLINDLKKQTKQNVNQQKQDKSSVLKKLKIESRFWNLQIQQTQESEQHFEKENKEWSTSTITYNYEQEYKQILALFQIELNEQNFHERLLKHINNLFKKVEQLTQSSALCKQKLKENARLGHHLRRLQGENAHFTNMANAIAKQYEKSIELLQFSNREVEKMHLDSLNRKYEMYVTDQNDLK